MISNKTNEVLNEQINKEFYSGYLYLLMSAKLKELGFLGFSFWLREQAKEEIQHGLRIYDYLIDSNSFVTFKQIRMPEFKYEGILSVFKTILEHEKCITEAIMNLATDMEAECDRMTLKFIDWFIEEQTQEEQTVCMVIKKLELFGDNKSSLYLIDQEMSQRKME